MRIAFLAAAAGSFCVFGIASANVVVERSSLTPPDASRVTWGAVPPTLPAATPTLFGSGIFAQRVIEEEEKRKKEEEARKEVKPRRPKSPWLAMALSAAVPGAGQFYVKGPNVMTFASVGVEAAGWLLKESWESDGHDKEQEYRDYAWIGQLARTPGGVYEAEIVREDGHWSWEQWRRDRGTECHGGENEDYEAADSVLVSFWFENRHEFYEDIGKYNRYDCGWYSPEYRQTYLSKRDEANDLLGRASTMSQVILLNHLASAVHAFFVAKSHNRHVVPETEINWDIGPEEGGGLRAQLLVRKHF